MHTWYSHTMVRKRDDNTTKLLRSIKADASELKTDVAVLKEHIVTLGRTLKIVESHIVLVTKQLELEADLLRDRVELLELIKPQKPCK